jgi:hypothetical protein
MSGAMIWLARTTVERRCAMTTVVLPSMRRSSAACTTASLAVSRAEVASSRRSTWLGLGLGLGLGWRVGVGGLGLGLGWGWGWGWG